METNYVPLYRDVPARSSGRRYGEPRLPSPIHYSPPPYSPSNPVYTPSPTLPSSRPSWWAPSPSSPSSPQSPPHLPQLAGYSSAGRQHIMRLMHEDLRVTDGAVSTCQPLYEWLAENEAISPELQSPDLEVRVAGNFESPAAFRKRMLLEPVSISPTRNLAKFQKLEKATMPIVQQVIGSADTTPDFTPPNARPSPIVERPPADLNTRICWMLGCSPSRRIDRLRLAAKPKKVLEKMDSGFENFKDFTPGSKLLISNYYRNCDTVLANHKESRRRKKGRNLKMVKRRLF